MLLKVDGFPFATVDRFVRERDPQTGKSRLPWFDHIFYQNGTRLNQLLRARHESVGPLVVFDRHRPASANQRQCRIRSRHSSHLRLPEFHAVLLQAGVSRQSTDMPGTEVIDSLGLPLLMDAYDNYQRLPGSQLYGRGVALGTLQRAGQAQLRRTRLSWRRSL